MSTGNFSLVIFQREVLVGNDLYSVCFSDLVRFAVAGSPRYFGSK